MLGGSVDAPAIAGAVLVLGGLAIATGIVYAFGWLVVAIFAPGLEADPTATRVASFLVGVVLCGFAVMVPARLAPAGDALRLAVLGVVPLLIMAMAIALSLGRSPRRPHLPRVRRFRLTNRSEWASAFLLLAVTVALVLVRPGPQATIELTATQQSDVVRVDITFARSEPGVYFLTTSNDPGGSGASRQFTSPTSGVVTFEIPRRRPLEIALTTDTGQILRRLTLP
jgi:hypothetical protein